MLPRGKRERPAAPRHRNVPDAVPGRQRPQLRAVPVDPGRLRRRQGGRIRIRSSKGPDPGVGLQRGLHRKRHHGYAGHRHRRGVAQPGRRKRVRGSERAARAAWGGAPSGHADGELRRRSRPHVGPRGLARHRHRARERPRRPLHRCQPAGPQDLRLLRPVARRRGLVHGQHGRRPGRSASRRAQRRVQQRCIHARQSRRGDLRSAKLPHLERLHRDRRSSRPQHGRLQSHRWGHRVPRQHRRLQSDGGRRRLHSGVRLVLHLRRQLSRRPGQRLLPAGHRLQVPGHDRRGVLHHRFWLLCSRWHGAVGGRGLVVNAHRFPTRGASPGAVLEAGGPRWRQLPAQRRDEHSGQRPRRSRQRPAPASLRRPSWSVPDHRGRADELGAGGGDCPSGRHDRGRDQSARCLCHSPAAERGELWRLHDRLRPHQRSLVRHEFRRSGRSPSSGPDAGPLQSGRYAAPAAIHRSSAHPGVSDRVASDGHRHPGRQSALVRVLRLQRFRRHHARSLPDAQHGRPRRRCWRRFLWLSP